MWDAVINHTGPATDEDPAWPDSWVRQSPTCDFTGYDGTLHCTLVENLPDIHTSLDAQAVEVPPFLLEKWEAEGRKEQELAELDAFFERTGYPRLPRYYLIKWLTDWVRELGIDAYRIDTAKHTEADLWSDLKKEAIAALRAWKQAHPGQKPDDLDFFMTGEVYGYNLDGGQPFDYGDTAVNFFDHGFESLINFGFKYHAKQSPEALFSRYANALNEGGPLVGKSVLNYLSSHDDGDPYDRERKRAQWAGTLLLLAPGSAQIYYGDETARPLEVRGANGDANLRSFMNWEDLEQPETAEVLAHWQKLGQFRRDHIAIGMGQHRRLSRKPYIFERRYQAEGLEDRVVVAMDLAPNGEPQEIFVGDVFANGVQLRDHYSGQLVTVVDGAVRLIPTAELALLAPDAR